MDVLQFALIGLGIGAIYALSAQGLVLIYRGSGVLNFAQGAMGMVGAFVFYDLRDERGWSDPWAMLAALGVAAALGGRSPISWSCARFAAHRGSPRSSPPSGS